MKALIINEDTFVTEELSSILKEKNIEIINYSWLLKAMDNIEEIQPDIIITNASEYPRHWKILAQFIKSGIVSKKIFFFLYTPFSLSEIELKKAETLGVDSIISSFEKTQIEGLYNIIFEGADKSSERSGLPFAETSDDYSDNCGQDEDGLFSVDMLLDNNKDNEIPAKGYYILTNPVTGQFISGKYLEFDGKKITCQIDNPDDFEGIEKNTSIKYVTYSNQFECKSFSATVNDYLEFPNEKFVILNICNMYEEE